MNFFQQKIKVGPIKRTKFDLGHERKLSLNVGKLVPIMVQDVIPGDTLKVGSEIFLRMAPMLAPIMHRVDVYTHYFFVPNRLMWDEWQKFITGDNESQGAPPPAFPTLRIDQYPATPDGGPPFGVGSLADYLGIGFVSDITGPTTNPLNISALPFRAYQMIYNDWYRDQTFELPIDISKTGGDQSTDMTKVAQTLLPLRTRAWEKDYFTTALPWPQRSISQAFAPIDRYVQDGTDLPAQGAATFANGQLQDASTANTEGQLLINELRKANALQKWLEKQARGGGRYIETILSHFGVKTSDARLQRPEYLGGGRQHVKISEVLSTFDKSESDLPQGNMSGHGISAGSFHGFTRSFEEHGYVIGIMSVLPRTSYQQGVEKHWTKTDKFDFAWPDFANLGEQEVKIREIYYDPMDAAMQGEGTFGYQSRYSEYKWKQSTVHGDFRTSLAFWQGGRIFSEEPGLNNTFLKCDNAEFDRVFAVTDPAAHKLWCQIYNSVDAIRPLPFYGTPKL